MAKSKIINIDGVSIDLSRIKAIKVKTNVGDKLKDALIIEFNSRFEYVFNPNENIHTKETIDDTVSIPQINYSSAVDARRSLAELWQEYLDSL